MDPSARRRMVGWAMAIAALLVLQIVPWTTRKPFLRQLHQVEVGMTRGEVLAIMAGYRQGTGWHLQGQELQLDAALVFRHSDDGRFNSDWGVVQFDEGRVSTVEFLPD